jgi:hypothetical protein
MTHRLGLVFVSLLAACDATVTSPTVPVPDAGNQADASTNDAGTDGAAPIVPLPTGRFRIGMWCGPPAAEMTKARMDEIAAAGFTTAANACDGSTSVPAYNMTMLSLAEQDGLDAIVSDSRISAALAGTNVASNLDDVVKDYSSAKGLAGYFIGDEPGAPAFPGIASVVAGLKTRDPSHFAYTNLLPTYATAGQLGTASYDDYVSQFLATVKPDLFSFDYYPFLTNGDDGGFFANLEIIRSHSIAAGAPFFQFTQAISFNGHRATTLAEKQWVGMQTLAYGGAGISYFTYWTPPGTAENFGQAIIDINGAETAQYAEVTAINARLTAFGRYLVAARSTAVFHNGLLAAGVVPRVPGMPAYLPSLAPYTVGLFTVGGAGDEYIFITNRDYTSAQESDVYVASSAPEALDVASGTFIAMATLGTGTNGTKVHVSLAAADATLIHLKAPVANGPPGSELYIGTVRSDAGSLDVVDSNFGGARLRAASWSDCPSGYPESGLNFQSNGFWFCPRSDLASHTFYVGNVVADAGELFEVKGGTATSMGAGSWDNCPNGSKLLGHRFDSNGYWVCM